MKLKTLNYKRLLTEVQSMCRVKRKVVPQVGS